MNPTISCQLAERDRVIDEFLLERLSPEESEAFEIHLLGCAECFDEAQFREQVITALQEIPAFVKQGIVPPRPARVSLAQRFADAMLAWRKPWIMAGMGLAAAVLAGILILTNKERGQEFAGQFQSNVRFESYVSQEYRSASSRIVVHSPRNGGNFEDDIRFQWETGQGRESQMESLQLKIIDNQETVVYEARVQGGEYFLRPSFPPGLYYWTLEDDAGTRYVGKFYFKQGK